MKSQVLFSQAARMMAHIIVTSQYLKISQCNIQGNKYIDFYTTRSTQNGRFDSKNAWFDTQMPFLTQKCSARYKNAISSMHQLTLPLSNILPTPYSNSFSFSNFIEAFCLTESINELN